MKRLTPVLGAGLFAAACASTSTPAEAPPATVVPIAQVPVTRVPAAETAAAQTDLSAQQAYLNEKALREDAETKANALTQINMALHRGLDATGAALAQATQVKETPEETVVTVSGAVLFETNEAKLMPIAEKTLGAVAEALEGKVDDKEIIIEGYTDSLGTPEHNEKLSELRAEEVRDFLAAHGLEDADVKTVGKGESDPIASNDTAEGRANNRRVEITVREAS